MKEKNQILIEYICFKFINRRHRSGYAKKIEASFQKRNSLTQSRNNRLSEGTFNE